MNSLHCATCNLPIYPSGLKIALKLQPIIFIFSRNHELAWQSKEKKKILHSYNHLFPYLLSSSSQFQQELDNAHLHHS